MLLLQLLDQLAGIADLQLNGPQGFSIILQICGRLLGNVMMAICQ